jgi:hypothetical protein
MRFCAAAAVAVLVGFSALSGTAYAAPTAKLRVGLSPNRLGSSTTMTFGFTISEPGGALPPALTVLTVQMPPGMAVNTTGLSTCSRGALAHGPQGCPKNSRVGHGSVLVRVPLGEVIRPERAALTVFNAPAQGGRTAVLFYAAGKLPIATQLIFPGVIITGPSGPKIEAKIPLIPTLPESPDGSIVEMTSTLGTREQTYFHKVKGREKRFTPKGATVPSRCSGEFAFGASFAFNDGSEASAAATVACPK